MFIDVMKTSAYFLKFLNKLSFRKVEENEVDVSFLTVTYFLIVRATRHIRYRVDKEGDSMK